MSKLPKRPSKLSPTKIAELLSVIESFEGPVNVEVMIPNKRLFKELGKPGPVLVLLGDFHIGDQKCDDTCEPKSGCYSLYAPSTFLDFADKLAKKHSISTDLFVEVWFSETSMRHISGGGRLKKGPSGQFNSAMADVTIETAGCAMQVQCPFPHIRTHMSDPRKVDSRSKYNAEWLFYSVLDSLGKYHLDDYREQLESNFPGFKSNYLLSLVSKMYTREYTMYNFLSEPFFQKYSRVYHEFVQLPKKVSEGLLRESEKVRHIKFLKEQRPNPEFKRFFDKLIIEDLYSKDLTSFYRRPILLDHLVDMYTIARALKRFRRGLDSELSIIYLGDYHIESIKAWTKTYYQGFRTYGRQCNGIAHPNKCIQRKKVCRNSRAHRDEVTKKEAKKIARDYLILDTGKKVDICKRLIKSGLAFDSSR